MVVAREAAQDGERRGRGSPRFARASRARRGRPGAIPAQREARRRVEDEAAPRRSARRTRRGSARSARATRRSSRRRPRRSRTCRTSSGTSSGTCRRTRRSVVARHAHVVHTVDSAALARELGKRARERRGAAPLPVLVEVNVGGRGAEARRRAERDRRGDATRSRRSASLALRGLMTMPPAGDLDAARRVFETLASLRNLHGGPARAARAVDGHDGRPRDRDRVRRDDGARRHGDLRRAVTGESLPSRCDPRDGGP